MKLKLSDNLSLPLDACACAKLKRLLRDEITRHEANLECGGSREYEIAKRASLSALKRLAHNSGLFSDAERDE